MASMVLLSGHLMADIVYPQEREERDYDTNAAEKLDRGIQNLITFPLEIPEAVWRNSGRDGGYGNRGVMKGTSDGIRNASIRFAQGMWDTFTFPWNTGNFEVPRDTEPIVVHPEWIPFMNWIIPTKFDEYVDKSSNDWYADKYEVWQQP